MTIDEMLNHSVELYANHQALVCDEKQYSYREFGLLVNAMAATLCEQGVFKGAKIALVMDDPIQFITAFFAIKHCGGIPIPVYSKTGEEKIKMILKDYEVDFLLVSSENENLLNSISHDVKRMDNQEFVLVTLRANSTAEPELMQTALILLTSGTTNRPKAIKLSVDNIWSNMEAISEYLCLTSEDRILMIKNLNHASSIIGELLVGLMNGCTVYLTQKLPRPSMILKVLSENEITVFFAVPTILKGIMSDKRRGSYLLPKLRIINFYGASMPKEDIFLLCEMYPNTNIIYSYGLTEASPRVTYIEKKDLLTHQGSSGRAIRGVTIHIVREDGTLADIGEKGEITVVGPNVMQGYYKNPERTEYVKRDNMLHTGDLGYMDESGFLYVVGRKDNMIISAGKNIYPEEIEGVLLTIPGIREALVIGGKGTNQVMDIKAYIVASKEEVTQSEIYSICRQRLENYKVPKEVYFVDQLEKTVSGKIKRKQSFVED